MGESAGEQGRLLSDEARVSLAVGAIVFVTALAVRLLWVLNVKAPAPPAGDFRIYDLIGISLSKGLGYVAKGQFLKQWGPGYPTMLGALYYLFGHSYLVARIANAVIGAASAAMLFKIGEKTFGPRVGVVAGLILALYPEHIYFSAVLASENLFMPLLLGSILAYLTGRERDDWRLLALAGLLMGAAALTRPVAAVVVPAVIIWELVGDAALRRTDWRTIAKRTGIFAIATAIAIAPWTVRNYIVIGEFVPLTTNGWVNLWMANNPNANGGYYFPEDGPLAEIPSGPVRDREAARLTIEFWKTEPVHAMKLFAKKLKMLYEPISEGILWVEVCLRRPLRDGLGKLGESIEKVAYIAIALSAVAGLVLSRLKRGPTWLFGLIFLFWSVYHGLNPAMRRYRLPIMPVMAVFSALALVKIVKYVGRTLAPRAS